jgi:hypothetical protein
MVMERVSEASGLFDRRNVMPSSRFTRNVIRLAHPFPTCNLKDSTPQHNTCTKCYRNAKLHFLAAL